MQFILLHVIFPHICARVMALELRQNFISAQYLENKSTEFHQILSLHLYWQVLAWDCNTSFFLHLYQSYGPWFTPKFRFPSISWEQIGRISPNFIYAFTLTRSSMGLIHIIFLHLNQSYGSLCTPKFLFHSISWDLTDISSPNFIYALILTSSSLALLRVNF